MKNIKCDCPWPCPIKHKKSCDDLKCPWRVRHVLKMGKMNDYSDKEHYKTSLSIVFHTLRGNDLGQLQPKP